MYLTLKHDNKRQLRLTRAWSLQNKTKNFDFSFSALLSENIHVSGTRGIRLHYRILDFKSENLSPQESDKNTFEFVLTEAGAISSDTAHTGHLADIAEDIRAAWLTPEIGIDGLRWTTQPGIHSKLEKPMRTFEAHAEHKIVGVKDDNLTVESCAEVSLKLESGVRMGPLHGSARQTTILNQIQGPTEMKRETKVILHDPAQAKPMPIHILSSLRVSEN
tara:strand:+ start:488 stop:1144 length:657 start_codon:yes stop_codon:yes gene_type:complete